MADLATLARFSLTTLLLELTPGPNMAFLATLAAVRGRAAGTATVAGIALGLTCVGLASALGLAALASQWPAALSGLRIAGVGYLLWLAWEAWREAGESSMARTSDAPAAGVWFRHGFLVNLLNPKAAVFYLAVLPGFVVSGVPAMPQVLLLTAISVAIATAVHLGLVALSGSLQPVLADPSRTRLARQIMAGLLVAVALWFAVSTA